MPPVTTPVEASTVASVVLLLAHVPPDVTSASVIVPPLAHTVVAPVIGCVAVNDRFDEVSDDELSVQVTMQ